LGGKPMSKIMKPAKILLNCILFYCLVGCSGDRELNPQNIRNKKISYERIEILCYSYPNGKDPVWHWEFDYNDCACIVAKFNGREIDHDEKSFGGKVLMKVFVSDLISRPDLGYETGFTCEGDRYQFRIFTDGVIISREYINPHSQYSVTGMLVSNILDDAFSIMKHVKSPQQGDAAEPASPAR
jgi:hypothetical protein